MPNDSIARRTRSKAPQKPRKDFPLSIHKGSGYWCKKIRGRVFYFGKISDDPKGVAALEEWDRVREDLYAGREPRENSNELKNELTVADLCNEFMTAKEHDVASGELGRRSWRAYLDSCALLVKGLGRNRVVVNLTPADLRELRTKLSKGKGLVALSNDLRRIRSVFLFALDEKQIPVPYKKPLRNPKPEALRRESESHRSEHGSRMFQAAEIRQILDEAKPALKAMTLLALNAALGQSDLSSLPSLAIDLDGARLDFARVKTGVARRVPLWDETVASIRAWLAVRPKAKTPDDSKLLFVTVRGARWLSVSERGATKDGINQEFNKVLNTLGLKRKRLAFYAFRHTFQTVGSRTKDELAVSSIMGHTDSSMAARYREGGIDDDRLQSVVTYVHDWLFPPDTDDDSTDDTPTLSIADASDNQTGGEDGDTPSLKLFCG